MANDIVTEETVYSCTGNPMPRDVESIFSWLLDSEFHTVYQRVAELQQLKGLALLDILNELHKYVMKAQFKAEVKGYLLEQFASLEARLSSGTSESMQLASMIAVFQIAREKNSVGSAPPSS